MRRRAAGFTLLEVVFAIAIFAFIAAAALATMANAGEMASSGKRARDLRMLAEVRMGEVLTFEKHWDDQVPYEGDFGDHPEWGDQFKDWKWQFDIRDVYVFGIATESDAQYLFGQPTDDEKNQAAQQQSQASSSSSSSPPGSSGGSSGTSTKKPGDPQKVRELTLRVTAPADEGGGDSVELVVFAPTLPQQAASGGSSGNSGK